jgi:predicted cobalt transporter CbtA
MLDKIMYYFHPKSLTWWAGVAMTAIGIALMLGADNPALGITGTVLSALTGGDSNAAPANLILMGLGLVGIRSKIGAA